MEIKVDSGDLGFEAMLISAVRYAVGRKTYIVGLVIDFITPLLPTLSNAALEGFDRDLTEREYEWPPPYNNRAFGDPMIDRPCWIKFLNDVREEKQRRGLVLYVPWRFIGGSEDDGLDAGR